MQDALLSETQLRAMLGARLRYRGAPYTVIDVMGAPYALILEADTPTSKIQADVNGNARREMRELLTVPVFALDGDELHNEFLQLNFL